jgi:hypothetical protein
MKPPAKATTLHQNLLLPSANLPHEAPEFEERQGYHTRMSAQMRKTKRRPTPTLSWKKSGS